MERKFDRARRVAWMQQRGGEGGRGSGRRRGRRRDNRSNEENVVAGGVKCVDREFSLVVFVYRLTVERRSIDSIFFSRCWAVAAPTSQ